ncbi:hypothetical protein D3C86_1727230 [compost metagenome]
MIEDLVVFQVLVDKAFPLLVVLAHVLDGHVRLFLGTLELALNLLILAFNKRVVETGLGEQLCHIGVKSSQCSWIQVIGNLDGTGFLDVIVFDFLPLLAGHTFAQIKIRFLHESVSSLLGLKCMPNKRG